MAMPSHVKYLIIGAGIHGLSTAWHLAEKLEAQGKGGGRDILVLDKTAIAAGASGIACGVSALLEPFRFSRYAEGRLHPTSHSPFPWS